MDKKRSKGSFLSFFDWNRKSQKNLFSHNPKSLPDVSKQQKENMQIMPMSQIKIDDNEENASSIACSDFSFALSISSDEEECGTNKSPGLVARLMGLDSLPPVPTVSLESSQFHEIDLHSMDDYIYSHLDSINMTLKSNNPSLCINTIESKTHRVENIEMNNRFQNETLPLKSAKPVSVTHNKLLAPIKSHGYMQPNNAAYIRNKMSSVEPLSVPLRTLDLQEKLKAAQHESQFNVNGKPTERSCNLYKSTPTFKGSRDSEINGSRLGKGKSVSLVTPSKTNVQSKDILNLNGHRSYMKHKNCDGQNSNVLRQNSLTIKCKSTSKVNTNKPTQTRYSENSTGARKTTNKCAVSSNVDSKRSRTRVTDHKQKDFSVCKRMSSSQKKRYDPNDTRGSDNVVSTYKSKSIKCNVTIDGSIYKDAFSMKESSDVISFTFTSPLRKQVMETRAEIDVDTFANSDKLYPGKLSLSPTKLHVIDGDTLSIMLEEKLQELTSQINPPQCSLATEWCSAGFKSVSEDSFHSIICTTSREQDRRFHLKLLSGKLDIMKDNSCSSSHMALSMNHKLQISEPTEDPSCSSNGEIGNDLCYQHTRTVTTSENPFISKSYLDSEDITCGSSIVYSSMQDEEVSTLMSNLVDFKRSTRTMELEYIKDILSNAEFMAEELGVSQTDNIIMPTLFFDIMENQRTGVESYYEEYSKLERKAIFDCVSECLELRCRQVFVARCKAWPRRVASVMMKNWLAEEVYKEMLEFRNMEEEVVVDKIVSKDMSTPLGRWLDFDIEAFENGLEFEFDILTYLIDELISDLWLV